MLCCISVKYNEPQHHRDRCVGRICSCLLLETDVACVRISDTVEWLNIGQAKDALVVFCKEPNK